MFKDFKPIDKKQFQIMDNDGKIINQKYMPKLSDNEILKAYKDMLWEQMTQDKDANRILTFQPPDYMNSMQPYS